MIKFDKYNIVKFKEVDEYGYYVFLTDNNSKLHFSPSAYKQYKGLQGLVNDIN